MPTKPYEPLLYRELRKAEAKKTIEIASPMLQETINYSTYVFARFQDSIKKVTPDEPLPIIASYHHIIGLADGIEVLISQSCVTPAIPLLRSMFEALLTIEYILKEDSQRRSFSWLVCYIHSRLRTYDMLDPSHEQGKKSIEALAREGLDKSMNLESLPDINRYKQNLQSLLAKPNYSIAEEEYQRIKRKRKHFPNWYSLFEGPGNLRELASFLNRISEYDFLYRYWSSIAHAEALSNLLTRTTSGSPAFKVFRSNKELGQVSKMASTYIIDSTRLIIDKYRHGENQSFATWYLKEIRAHYLSLE
jgi:hypothetical protein